jgi:hypothetical protein
MRVFLTGGTGCIGKPLTWPLRWDATDPVRTLDGGAATDRGSRLGPAGDDGFHSCSAEVVWLGAVGA